MEFPSLTLVTGWLARHQLFLDSAKVLFIGCVFSYGKQFAEILYNAVIDCWTVRATLDRHSDAYHAVRYYFLRHSLPLTHRTSFVRDLWEALLPRGLAPPRKIYYGNHKPWNGSDEGIELLQGASKSAPKLYATPDMDHDVQYFNYKGKTIQYRFEEESRSCDDLLIMTTYGRSRRMLSQFIQEAQLAYQAISDTRLQVYQPEISSDDASWSRTVTRNRRRLDTVALSTGIKDGVMADVRDFLAEKEFYRARNLPYRRGWLLYGVPGAGKTSFITAIASELKLNIYLMNLGSNTLDDEAVQRLFRRAPANCMLVIEDIDCASGSTAVREDEDVGSNGGDMFGKKKGTVTLSGLLNAVDGIASSEGRLLFCTTNHIEHIDPALIRPGRCDVRVEFKNASKEQAALMFESFYLSVPPKIKKREAEDRDKLLEAAEKNPRAVVVAEGGQGDMDPERIRELSRVFGERVPEQATSTSAIQGYLLRFKRQPAEAVDGVQAWVEGGFKPEPVATSSTLITG